MTLGYYLAQNSAQPYIFLIDGSREPVNLGILATFPVHKDPQAKYISKYLLGGAVSSTVYVVPLYFRVRG